MQYQCIIFRARDLTPRQEYSRGDVRNTYEEAEMDGKTFVGRCGPQKTQDGLPFPLDWNPVDSFSYSVEEVLP